MCISLLNRVSLVICWLIKIRFKIYCSFHDKVPGYFEISEFSPYIKFTMLDSGEELETSPVYFVDKARCYWTKEHGNKQTFNVSNIIDIQNTNVRLSMWNDNIGILKSFHFFENVFEAGMTKEAHV